MKILLSWVQKHIRGIIDTNKIDFLISKFNTSVAEIENFIPVTTRNEDFEIAKIVEGKLFLPSKKEVLLNSTAIFPEKSFVLLKKINNEFCLATLKDFGQERESIFPCLHLSDKEFEESLWRMHIPEKDFILEVDNKSLTNRPDMWSHRGFAREIALILGLELKPKAELLSEIELEKTEKPSFDCQEFSFENKALSFCHKFSLAKFEIQESFSIPAMAFPLATIGAKPISTIVDLTNYLMFDWGFPVHAFNPDGDFKQNFAVRLAEENESISVLGGVDLKLTNKDFVISINDKLSSLTGIKGGIYSSVEHSTKRIFLEAGIYSPSLIREVSQRHKIRTDASAIYEKKITSSCLEDVHARFLQLAKKAGIDCRLESKVYVSGAEEKIIEITVSHLFLEQKIGRSLDSEKIISLLSALEFEIKKIGGDLSSIIYLIKVPFFRSTKNVTTPEDIFEEVARLSGFENVPTTVPRVLRSPFDLENILKLRQIKKYFAYYASMIEQANYPFFDEAFLEKISYEPENFLFLKNPVSENQKRLVSSLLPGLLKNILTNFFYSEKLSFFEVAKVWTKGLNAEFLEKKVVSGIFFERHRKIDFYDQKEVLNNLSNLLGINNFIWKKTETNNLLFDENKTGDLYLNELKIGQAGLISNKILASLNNEFSPAAFFFELDVEPLLKNQFVEKKFQGISKYQSSYLDISGFIPQDKVFEDFYQILSQVDPLITEVSLIDVFEKNGQKSLTFRLHLESLDRSVEKNDLDMISLLASKAFSSLGGIVR